MVSCGSRGSGGNRNACSDMPIGTRAEKLEFLTFGSLTLRCMFYILQGYILKPNVKKSKLLVTEATPLYAWFYEVVLRFAYLVQLESKETT